MSRKKFEKIPYKLMQVTNRFLGLKFSPPQNETTTFKHWVWGLKFNPPQICKELLVFLKIKFLFGSD